MNNQQIYTVATIPFAVTDTGVLTGWQEVAWHYEPFVTPAATPVLRIELRNGTVDTTGQQLVFAEEPNEPGTFAINVYEAPDKSMVFALRFNGADAPDGWLETNADFSDAVVTINEADDRVPQWHHTSTLTSCLMMAYMLAATPRDVLLSHAAAVINDGKAYLFIAKSGTGKSTHSRLWMKNIPDTLLLNDDHPVVHAAPDGTITAYGSPWSGKTHCYKNQQAPLGAMVRIHREKHNQLHRLTPIQAYASLKTSFSGLSWHPEQGDGKHATIEKIIMSTPCYTIDCLPDDEAAIVCHDGIKADESSC